MTYLQFCFSIWNHLVQITKDGNKTVIITTHYIEEARQAHTVSIRTTSSRCCYWHSSQQSDISLAWIFCTWSRLILAPVGRVPKKLFVCTSSSKTIDLSTSTSSLKCLFIYLWDAHRRLSTIKACSSQSRKQFRIALSYWCALPRSIDYSDVKIIPPRTRQFHALIFFFVYIFLFSQCCWFPIINCALTQQYYTFLYEIL